MANSDLSIAERLALAYLAGQPHGKAPADATTWNRLIRRGLVDGSLRLTTDGEKAARAGQEG